MGLLKTNIDLYYPHFLDKKDGTFFSRGNRVWDTALGSSKRRKIDMTAKKAQEMFGIEFSGKPAIDYAKRALGSAKAVTSAEFYKTLPQFTTKEGGIALKQSTMDAIKKTGIELPKDAVFAKDVARQIDSYVTRIQPEELNVFIKSFDAIQSWWQALALVAPGYHIRNEVGNVWNNHLRCGIVVKDYIQAGAIQKGKLIEFTDDIGRQWNTSTIATEAQKSGVLGRGWYAADIEQGIKSELGGRSWNPLKQNFALFKGNRAVGEAFENNARLAHFIRLIKEGNRSEERRVGKECRSRWSPYH